MWEALLRSWLRFYEKGEYYEEQRLDKMVEMRRHPCIKNNGPDSSGYAAGSCHYHSGRLEDGCRHSGPGRRGVLVYIGGGASGTGRVGKGSWIVLGAYIFVALHPFLQGGGFILLKCLSGLITVSLLLPEMAQT